MKYLSLITFFLISNLVSANKIDELNEFNGDLSSVTEIDLSNKGLIEFPLEILECKNLQKLNLSNNGIVNIPDGLSELTELKSLNFSDNQGLSELDLDQMLSAAKFSLEVFNLSGCEMYYLPSSIVSQKSLINLNLSDNKLFKLPYGMMIMDKLEEINLSNNKLKDVSWLVSYWWSLKIIDVSNNEDFLVSSLLLSLSYFDQLNKIVISEIDYIPSEFSFLVVNELVIKNSLIDYFPRADGSMPIDKIVFDECEFNDVDKIAKTIETSCQPNYIGFNNMVSTKLLPFLSVGADSVSIKNAGLLNILPLSKVENLKWLDIRGNDLVKGSLNKFKVEKPDIQLLYVEPVIANVGINPPIKKYVQKPIIKKFRADKEEKIQLGKSVFVVPENSLMDKNGEIYKGVVSFEYTEYTSPAEIFLSGITMTSTVDDETMLLSSGGMINVEAKDGDGNSLTVNPDIPILVEISSDNPNGSMDLWKLDNSGGWEKIGKDSLMEPFKLDMSRMDSVMNQDFLNMARMQVQYTGDRLIPKIKRNRRLGTFELTFECLKTWRKSKKILHSNDKILVPDYDYSSSFLCDKTFVFDGDSVGYYSALLENIRVYSRDQYKRLRLDNSEYYSAEGPNFLSKLRLSPDYNNDRFDLSFKYKGKNIQFPVLFKPKVTNANAAIKDAQSLYREYVRAEKKRIKSNRRYKIRLEPILCSQENVLFEMIRQKEVYRQMALYKRQSVFNQAQMDSLATNGVSVVQTSIQRDFTMNGFGSFNCDQRSRMKNPTTIAARLVNEETNNQVEEKIIRAMLIDHSINGTLQYQPGSEIFIDGAAKSTIIFFFSATLVGIYHSWKNKLTNNHTEIQMLDITNMPREEFILKISE